MNSSEASMEIISIKSKIEKLQRMAATTGPESENANRLIQKLIQKYQLSPDQIQEPKRSITYRLHRLKKYGLHLAKWMDIDHHSITGNPDCIVIYVDSDEYKMFHELMDEIKHQFNKHENLFRKEGELQYGSVMSDKVVLAWKNHALKSFMKGYMDTNYSYDRTMCPKCKKGKVNLQKDGHTFMCVKCLTIFKSTSYRGFSKIDSAFMKGVNTTTKSIRQNRLMIT